MLDFIMAALALAPKLIALGEDLTPLAEKLYVSITSSTGPTDADKQWLTDLEASLDARLAKRAQDAAGGAQ